MLRHLPFSDDECPYADLALRNEYRSIVDGLEAKHTGTKFAILASYEAIRPSLAEKYPQADLQLCECGEPTCNQRCMTCVILDEMRKMV